MIEAKLGKITKRAIKPEPGSKKHMKRSAIFPIALIMSACANIADRSTIEAAQCMAEVLKMAPTVQDVRIGIGYSWRDKQYEPTITYRYLSSVDGSRSVTFDVAKVSTGYAYFANEADGGREDSPVDLIVANGWYDRCNADGVIVTM